MLVLTRKCEEGFILNEGQTVMDLTFVGTQKVVLRFSGTSRIERAEKPRRTAHRRFAGSGTKVLKRKAGQKIILDHDSTITILRIRGQSVSFGFEGPVRIMRDELSDVA